MNRILSFLHGQANLEDYILINHQSFVFVIANCELVTLQRGLRREYDKFHPAKQEVCSSKHIDWRATDYIGMRQVLHCISPPTASVTEQKS
jgi:hypothetical protein